MDGRRVILNPGTNEIRLEGANAGQTEVSLWLYIPNMTLEEVFRIVIVPENLQTIRYEYGEMAEEYTGYTRVSVVQDGLNEISVCLKHTEEVNDNVHH